MSEQEKDIQPDNVGAVEIDLDPTNRTNDMDALSEAINGLRSALDKQNELVNARLLAMARQNQAMKQQLVSFEQKMTTLVEGGDFVKRVELSEAIRVALEDYPTIKETKVMVDAVEDQIKPVTMHLEVISQNLQAITALAGTVTSLERDVIQARSDHESQQQQISSLASDLKVTSNNLSSVTRTLLGVDGYGGLLREVRDNRDTLLKLSPVVPQVTEIRGWVAEQKAIKAAAMARRAERIEMFKGIVRSKRFWGAIGTGAGGVTLEALRQSGVLDVLINFIFGG